MSLSRNCPGIADRAGKPRVGSHPGVVNTMDRVVAKRPIARMAPTADALGKDIAG